MIKNALGFVPKDTRLRRGYVHKRGPQARWLNPSIGIGVEVSASPTDMQRANRFAALLSAAPELADALVYLLEYAQAQERDDHYRDFLAPRIKTALTALKAAGLRRKDIEAISRARHEAPQ